MTKELYYVTRGSDYYLTGEYFGRLLGGCGNGTPMCFDDKDHAQFIADENDGEVLAFTIG